MYLGYRVVVGCKSENTGRPGDIVGLVPEQHNKVSPDLFAGGGSCLQLKKRKKQSTNHNICEAQIK